MKSQSYSIRNGFLALLAAIAIAFPPASRAQVRGLSVSASTYVSSDSPKDPFYETFLAVNPRDDKNLIATSCGIADGNDVTWVYASRDGGHTWQRAQAVPGGTDTLSGDAVVYFDAHGTAFFGVLAGLHNFSFLLSRSEDGGFTWGPPLAIPGGGYDRESIAFDTSGKYKGRMYAGGTLGIGNANGDHHRMIGIVYSTDHGHTFSQPSLVEVGGQGHITVVSDLLVASDGTLVVPYEIEPFPGAPGTGRIWTMVSEDGGRTFLPAQKGPTISYAPSADRAAHSMGNFHVAIDASPGRFRNRIYLTWNDFNGKKYAIKMVHSDNLGKTWSEPVTVSDNANDNDPSNPGIAINKDGAVAVAFNDRRDDPKNSCFRLYYAVSVDGGETFLPNVKGDDHPACLFSPENRPLSGFGLPANPNALNRAEKRWTVRVDSLPDFRSNGGETQGMVAGSDGVFHSAFIAGNEGVAQLWFNSLTVDKTQTKKSPFSQPRKDVSGDLRLEIGESKVDFAAHTLSMNVHLVNPLLTAVSGPFAVVLEEMTEQTSLTGMQAMNSDNGYTGRGAVWNFAVNALQPGQKSEERTFTWKFTGAPSEKPKGVLHARFAILGPPQR